MTRRALTERERCVLNHAVPNAEDWADHCFGAYAKNHADKEHRRVLRAIEVREAEANEGLASCAKAREAPDLSELKLAQITAAEGNCRYALQVCKRDREAAGPIAAAHGQAMAEKALAEKIKRWGDDHMDIVTGALVEGYDSCRQRLGTAYRTRAQRDAAEADERQAKELDLARQHAEAIERERAAFIAEIVQRVKAELGR